MTAVHMRRAPRGCDYQGRHPDGADGTPSADGRTTRDADAPLNPRLVRAVGVMCAAVVALIAVGWWRVVLR